MNNLYALGPKGTNGHEAACLMRNRMKGDSPDILMCESHTDVFRHVLDESCFGVVPVENNTRGLVDDTIIDFWMNNLLDRKKSVYVVGEAYLPVHHVLATRPGVEITKDTPVLSHPQALAQCRNNLKRLGLSSLVPVNSTARGGVMIATESKHALSAAILSPFAAKIWNLQILQDHMEDHPGNGTRFHLLGDKSCSPTGKDCTAMIFWAKHRPRALSNALWAIGVDGVNMTSIHSIALGAREEYAFYVEFEEHIYSKVGQAIMKRFDTVTDHSLWLGSYPREERSQ